MCVNVTGAAFHTEGKRDRVRHRESYKHCVRQCLNTQTIIISSLLHEYMYVCCKEKVLPALN